MRGTKIGFCVPDFLVTLVGSQNLRCNFPTDHGWKLRNSFSETNSKPSHPRIVHFSPKSRKFQDLFDFLKSNSFALGFKRNGYKQRKFIRLSYATCNKMWTTRTDLIFSQKKLLVFAWTCTRVFPITYFPGRRPAFRVHTRPNFTMSSSSLLLTSKIPSDSSKRLQTWPSDGLGLQN